MKIATNGIVFNELTQILMMQRNDTRTWAPPGGMLDASELPTDGVAREVHEETGLKVLPVRLVGLYFVPARPDPILLFSFRCIQRGGSLQTSAESPQVGWFPTQTLPRRILSFHRERIDHAFHHQGGPPRWQTQPRSWRLHAGWWVVRNVIYRFMDWRRARNGEPPYQPPPSWQINANVVLPNDKGEHLWVQRNGSDGWQLPGGAAVENEAPWQTAVRTARAQTGLYPNLTNLTGVYVRHGRNEMTFTFTATAANGQPATTAVSYTAKHYPPAAPPDGIHSHQREQVADALAPGATTVFKHQVE